MLEVTCYIVAECVNHDRQTEVAVITELPQLIEGADLRIELESNERNRNTISARLNNVRDGTAEVSERRPVPDCSPKGLIDIHRNQPKRTSIRPPAPSDIKDGD